MTDTLRLLLIGLGIAVLVVVLVPLVVMSGMMGAGLWVPIGLVLMILLLGGLLLALGLRRYSLHHDGRANER